MATILAIDDDPIMLKLIEASLRNEGFQVQSATNANIAESQLAKQTFSLIILDLNLGEGKPDGFALLRTIRSNARNASTPVLMLTGESNNSVAERTRAAGASGYLVKPIRRDWLVKRVNDILDSVGAAS